MFCNLQNTFIETKTSFCFMRLINVFRYHGYYHGCCHGLSSYPEPKPVHACCAANGPVFCNILSVEALPNVRLNNGKSHHHSAIPHLPIYGQG